MPNTSTCVSVPPANNMLMACPRRMHLALLSGPIFIELVDLKMLALDVVHDKQVSYFSKNAASAALLLHRAGDSGRERNFLALQVLKVLTTLEEKTSVLDLEPRKYGFYLRS